MSRVVVCGSINIDLVATVNRLPGPGETVAGSGFATYPGGKGANQAVAAARAGGNVVLLGAVGADPYGAELNDFLMRYGVDTSYLVARSGVATGTAPILVDQSGENMIVVVPGANGTVDGAVATAVPLSVDDVLVAQFETPVDATLAFFRHGAAVGAIRILNPAPAMEISRELLDLVNILIVNETELALLTGSVLSIETCEADLREAASRLAGMGLNGSLIVTLGARGAVALADGEVFVVDGHRVPAVDTTGAGDCFVGCLATELTRDATLLAALRYANAASALAVQTPGAGSAMPSHEQVKKFIGS